MTSTITHEELLAELERITQGSDGDGWMTVQEIMAATNRGRPGVTRFLHAAKQEGRLLIGKKKVAALDGHMRAVSAYKIKPATKGKKK